LCPFGAWNGVSRQKVAREGFILFLDDVVLGGGNAKRLPFGCRIGSNANAFVGGFRLWKEKGKQS
jgi:polyphosphate glucokinase